MKTSKPISTISFNSKLFLYQTLKKLLEEEIIAFFAMIKHQGEEHDETGTGKNHYHIYIEPNKLINTEALRKEFVEPVQNDKPLKCMPFIPSKNFSDWYLYVLHDPVYLTSKEQSRQYCYSRNDIITSDEEYLNFKVSEIKSQEVNTYLEINEYIAAGKSFTDYCIQKNLNPMKIKAHENAWQMVLFKRINSKEDFELKENAELTSAEVPQISKKT